MNSLRDDVVTELRRYLAHGEADYLYSRILTIFDKYYSEKPGGLVAIDKDGSKREMSLQEVVEWAKVIATYHTTMDYCLPINGERVEVKK